LVFVASSNAVFLGSSCCGSFQRLGPGLLTCSGRCWAVGLLTAVVGLRGRLWWLDHSCLIGSRRTDSIRVARALCYLSSVIPSFDEQCRCCTGIHDRKGRADSHARADCWSVTCMGHCPSTCDSKSSVCQSQRVTMTGAQHCRFGINPKVFFSFPTQSCLSPYPLLSSAQQAVGLLVSPDHQSCVGLQRCVGYFQRSKTPMVRQLLLIWTWVTRDWNHRFCPPFFSISSVSSRHRIPS